MTVAVGYVKVRHDRIEKEPDQRVREALALVFSKFAEFQSMRQVHLWFRQEHITLPVVRYSAEEGRNIAWRLPVYNTIHHILRNPIYAGISFGSLRVGAAVGAEVVRLMKPFGVAAALGAIEQRTSEAAEKRRQVELALKQERFEAAHARRQYDAVDPDNRLVASELERRWNDKLIEARRLEDELEAFDTQLQPALGEQERENLMRLGADLEIAWSHPAATVATRKRIVRAILHEIVVRVENDRIEMVLHWQGGDHTPLQVKKNVTGKSRWTGTGADDAGPIHCGGSQSRRQTHRP